MCHALYSVITSAAGLEGDIGCGTSLVGACFMISGLLLAGSPGTEWLTGDVVPSMHGCPYNSATNIN